MRNDFITTKQLAYCGLFFALITVGSFIKIPIYPVPFTLQFFSCVTCILLLGAKLSFITIGCYIILGLIGVPIFANGGGITYILNPSFGYLIGFLLSSLISGSIAKGMFYNGEKKLISLLIASLSAVLVTHLIGVTYLYFNLNYYLNSAVTVGQAVIIGSIRYLPTDLIMCVLSALITKTLYKRKIIKKG